MELYGSEGSQGLAGEFLDFIKNIGRSGARRGGFSSVRAPGILLQLEIPSMLETKSGESSSFWKTFFSPRFLLLQREECLKAGAEGLMSPSRRVRELRELRLIGLTPRLLTLRAGLEDLGQKPERENIIGSVG